MELKQILLSNTVLDLPSDWNHLGGKCPAETEPRTPCGEPEPHLRLLLVLLEHEREKNVKLVEKDHYRRSGTLPSVCMSRTGIYG